MIQELTMYTVSCDRCLSPITDGKGNMTGFESMGEVIEAIKEVGWVKEEQYVYCSHCYHMLLQNRAKDKKAK